MIGPDPEREPEHLQFLEHVDTMLIGHGVPSHPGTPLASYVPHR